MRTSGLVAVACAAVMAASSASAQVREPVRGGVLDLRLASVALPSSEGWTPALPAGTPVPSRGAGVEAGAHLYPVSVGRARLGLGLGILSARGRTTPAADAAGDVLFPEVETVLTVVSPTVSLNFGHRLGWSYLSGGPSRAHVTSQVTTDATRPTSWSGAWHLGGGARWFLRDHVALNLDLRLHGLAARSDAASGLVTAPASRGMTLSAGLSLR